MFIGRRHECVALDPSFFDTSCIPKVMRQRLSSQSRDRSIYDWYAPGIEIGRGAQGIVMARRHLPTHEVRAVKQVHFVFAHVQFCKSVLRYFW